MKTSLAGIVLLAGLLCVPSRAPAARSPDPFKTYSADGRAPLKELYRGMDLLAAGKDWVMETVFVDQGLPVRVLRSKRKGPAVWVLAGIHGEEPAPPNAVLQSRARLDALARNGIPIVVFPLCNPVGYAKGWRYPDAARAPGHSVGDSDHLLFGAEGKPRAPKAASAQADALTAKVLKLAKDYPPVLSLDLHEDDELEAGYLYSQGPKGRSDPAAAAVVARMRELGIPVMGSGKTRFGEAVENGVIADVSDGSIDELIASTAAFAGKTPARGPSGRSVLVVETSSKGRPLAERIRAHSEVLILIPELFRLAGR
ncbi:MAG: hypothetical protein WC943_10175 [Elusimicrobiota bacterium]|jgi:hypothetical protein